MQSRSAFLNGLLRTITVLGCLLLLTGWRLGTPLSFFEEEGAIAKAVSDLSKAGERFNRVISIDVTPTEIRIEAQDPNEKRHVNTWRIIRMNIRSLNWEAHKGPEPVQLNLINPDLEANLFDLANVDFKAADKLMRDAIKRAELEDAASITSMEIRRQLFLLPNPSSGDVRWTVSVGSGRENASLVADARGNIVRVDFAGTNRAKTFNLLRSLEMLPDAAVAFAQTVGIEPVLIKARVSSRGVTFETNIEEKSALFVSLKQRQVFNWNLNGLTRSLGNVDTSQYFGAEPPFSVKDTDWSLAGELVRRAKDALGMADAELTEIELSKPKDQPGNPQLEWEITFELGGEEGIARYDAKGEPLGQTLPESRRKPFDGRDPAAWAESLSKIEETFGAKAFFSELILDSDRIRIVAEDPQAPGKLGQFFLEATGMSRFGSVSPFDAANPRFTLADLKALTPDQLGKLKAATIARLGLKPEMITSITIGKASLDPSPTGNVTVEIRAEEAPFGRGGRVNWEIDGREIKAYLPD
jgi:hypothetical protein